VSPLRPPQPPGVADNMVLGRFVDAGAVPLLAALAGGRVFVTPTILDPQERPPFVRQPTAEFAKGIFAAQRDLSRPLFATRVQRRTAFYGAVGSAWDSVALSSSELAQARFFESRAAFLQAKSANPTIKRRRVDAGEAECAAVAVTRGWALWTDDAAIIDVLAALHPGHSVERVSDLLSRAVREALLACEEAADLYNRVFKGTLGLWTRLTLVCHNGQIAVEES